MKNDLEALKFVADWSKWIASIQSGIISIFGATLLTGSFRVEISISSIALAIAIVLFLTSIISASFILYALPGMSQRLRNESSHDVLFMHTYNGRGIRLGTYCKIEFVCFVAGLFCLALMVICLLV